MAKEAAKRQREKDNARGTGVSTSDDEGGSEGAESSQADEDLEADRQLVPRLDRIRRVGTECGEGPMLNGITVPLGRTL